MRATLFFLFATACGGEPAEPEACGPPPPLGTTRLSVTAQLEGGRETTLCSRLTLDAPLEVTGFVGDLGAAGHHALLLVDPEPTVPSRASSPRP